MTALTLCPCGCKQRVPPTRWNRTYATRACSLRASNRRLNARRLAERRARKEKP